MAKGATHTLATFALGAVGCAYLPFPDRVWWGVGALCAILIQPDLDQLDGDTNGYYGLQVIRETFGRLSPVADRLWRMYWLPYARAFSHRSFWTHAPLVGTAIRLFYAFWYVAIFNMIIHIPAGMNLFVTAIIAADMLHWLMDIRAWGWVGMFRQ